MGEIEQTGKQTCGQITATAHVPPKVDLNGGWREEWEAIGRRKEIGHISLECGQARRIGDWLQVSDPNESGFKEFEK